MPITVKGLPSSVIDFPTSDGSEPKRRCQSASLSTTTGSYGYLTWYYGPSSVNGGKPDQILAQDGFAPVPNAWKAAVNRLLTAPLTGINVKGTGSCKTVKNGA